MTLLGCSTLLVPTNPSIAASPDKFKHYSASLLQILQRYQLKKTSLFWPKCSARHSPKLPYSSSWPGGKVFRLYLSLILSPGLFLKTSTKVLFFSLNTGTCSKTWQCDHCCRWWVCGQQDARQDTKLSTRAQSRPPPPPCLHPPGMWDLHSIYFSAFRAWQKRSWACVLCMYSLL